MNGSFILFVDSIIVLIFCLLVLLSFRRQMGFSDRVFQLLVGAFFLRVVTVLFVESVGTTFGQFDFFKFDDALWQTARMFREGIFSAPFVISQSNHGNLFYIPYTILYAPVYTVFGHETLLVRYIFALIGTLFVLNMYRIGEAIYNRTAGMYAAGFAAVFPYWLYLSAIFYRDMLIMLVLSQLLLVVIRTERIKAHIVAPSVIVLTALSLALRPENIIPVGVIVSFAGYRYFQDFWPHLSKVSLAGGFLAILSIGRFFGVIPSSDTVEQIGRHIDGLASGGGVYLQGIVPADWASVLSFFPIGALYFLLVPFPWQVHNLLALVAVLQNIVIWYPTLILAFLGFPYLFSRRPFVAVLLIGFAMSGIIPYGLLERNMGPALRHRSQFQMVFVFLAAIMVSERQVIWSEE